MKLSQITKNANDAEQMVLFALTGAAPALWGSLTVDQQGDLMRTAKSEVTASPLDLVGLEAWVAKKRAEEVTPALAAHVAFQTVCYTSRIDYVAE